MIKKLTLCALSLFYFILIFISVHFLFANNNKVPSIQNHDPVIDGLSTTQATEDQLFKCNIIAHDPDGDTLRYYLTVAPSAMTIDNSSGVMSWIPLNVNVGDKTVIVQVNDGKGGADTDTFKITITNVPPKISGSPKAEAWVDSMYYYDAQGDDEKDGYSWYKMNSSPIWLRLIDDSLGIIKGIPFEPDEGRYPVEIILYDGHGDSAVQSFELTVRLNLVPKLQIEKDLKLINFGQFFIGSSKDTSFVISNRGNNTLFIWSISVTDSVIFKLTEKEYPIILQKDENKNITVKYAPTRPLISIDYLTITSNHNNQVTEHKIVLLGEGIRSDFVPPLINHEPVASATEGSSITINANVSDNISGVAFVILYFRKGGQVHYDSLNLVTGNAIIPGDAVTTMGIEYYITARDSAYNVANHPSPSGFHSIQVNTIDEGKKSKRNLSPTVNMAGTCLISIPLILDSPDPEDVLEDDLGQYDIKEWRFFEYNQGEFIEFPITSRFIPGKGFLLITKRDSIEFDTGPGISVSTSDTCSFRIIDLDKSWSFIGNPYDFSILSDSLTLANGEPLTNLWSFENNGWHYMPQVIEPWKGYAVKPNSETKLIIHPVSSKILPQLQKSVINTQAISGQWAIQIQASCQQAQDVDNYAGVRQNASYQWDSCDLYEPPPIGNYVMVNFPHLDWLEKPDRYSADYQPMSEEGNSWQFEVKTNLPSPDVKLEFKKIGIVPEDFQIFLIDTVLQITQDLRKEREYTFHHYTQESGKVFKLLVGTDDFIHGKTSIDLVPKSYKLFQNFPNPFNQETSIIFQLPESGQVTMQVFNLRGKLIKTLVNNEYREAGYYTINWNGKDENEYQVSSGIYFYKLTAGSWEKTRKMTLLR